MREYIVFVKINIRGVFSYLYCFLLDWPRFFFFFVFVCSTSTQYQDATLPDPTGKNLGTRSVYGDRLQGNLSR